MARARRAAAARGGVRVALDDDGDLLRKLHGVRAVRRRRRRRRLLRELLGSVLALAPPHLHPADEAREERPLPRVPKAREVAAPPARAEELNDVEGEVALEILGRAAA